LEARVPNIENKNGISLMGGSDIILNEKKVLSMPKGVYTIFLR